MKITPLRIIGLGIVVWANLLGCSQKIDPEFDSVNSLTKDDGTIYSVEQAIAHYGLKGLSVAVFENYQLSWTATWGVKDAYSNDKIDSQTAFSAASIAKGVTSTLFAILEDEGLIDLKEPVKNYLKRWHLPESKWTENVEVTLEHLLSHTAGTSQHGFRDFYLGDSIPSMVQSLNGEIPDDNEKITFKFKPGSSWSYSGGGYVIAQMAVEDKLGRPLADLAQDYLFDPLGMRNTTLKQPNEEGFLTNVAKAHDESGAIISTGVPITPQIAPSGLWTTPSDMAVFMIAIQMALRGEKGGVITPEVADRITEVVTTDVLGGWSMGWERRYGFGNNQWFSHGGANTGTGGHVYATMENGHGIAFFGNGPNQVRFPVLDQLRNSIVNAHGWYHSLDKSKEKTLPVELAATLKGNYSHLIFGEEARLKLQNEKLIFENFVPGKPNTELVYIGQQTFLVDEYPSSIRFESIHDTLYIRPQHLASSITSGYSYMKTGS